jgi:succinate dehydrogenase / fumarate reductase cytochrome b subunit
VIFHAFNGLRVIVVDLWTRGARYQAQLSTAVWVITLALFLPSAFIMLRPLFE